MDNVFLTAWVASIPGIGFDEYTRLHDRFPDLGHILKASSSDIQSAGISAALANDISVYRYKYHPQEIKQFCVREKVHLIPSPPLLSEIPDPPIVLYIRGEMPDFSRPAIAIVGTRNVTDYGVEVTKKLTTGLVAAGYTIISGFMYGVDTVAHGATLHAGGKTIAVLGYGLGVPFFPRSHEKFAREIEARGSCLLTEFPPWQTALPQNFPKRNRIVSGLSLGVVVTEAAVKSGSLITARLAVDQGREVFAVSGPIGSVYSEGTKELVNLGAKLVTNVSDIVEELQR
jgi:DNA processing protein